MPSGNAPRQILVSGDVVIDHHLYEGRRKHYGDGHSPGVRHEKQPGGANLIELLLDQLLKKERSQRKEETSEHKEKEDGTSSQQEDPPQWESRLAIKLPDMDKYKSDDTSKDAYAFWRPFPQDAATAKQFWRVSEAMGFGAVQVDPPCKSWDSIENLPPTPDIIVLSEGGMGFRQNKDCWKDLNFTDAQWIVFKTTAPLFEGELWEKLTLVENKHRERLVVVVSAGEIHKSVARLSGGLSWDETLETLIHELHHKLADLCKCRHLLVTFESEGGVWVNFKEGEEPEYQLVYSAASIEGEQRQATTGSAFGFLSCVTAAVVWQLTMAEPDETPDLAAALEGGLSATYDLLATGHGLVRDRPKGFPAERLANVIKHPTRRYSRAIPRKPLIPGWSLLQEAQRHHDPAYELGRLVVKYGPIALDSLPHLAIGNLITVGRREIESLRTLSQVISRYKEHSSGKKPLSIGVFGPPGSGKSFAVKQLAKNLVGTKGWMEFNLSQFDTPSDLIGAFHQIRDRVLQGLLPVAFFDEFDSQNYRWLQYLLAPMQDGFFQEGQITHPLGKCIFAFAGGTSWTFGTFGPPPPTPGSPDETEEYTDFRLKKGPDFQSRLDGYLDVIGPNQRLIPMDAGCSKHPAEQYSSGRPFITDAEDLYFPIRRALMIRGAFGCAPDAKLEIDEGLVAALLQVKTYRHGSRSLNKILQPLVNDYPDAIHASLLAPADELAMHTNSEDFLKLVDETTERAEVPQLSDAVAQKIAPQIHGVWNRLGMKEGWDTKDVKYAALDKFKVLSNEQAAKGMPRILALVGLELEDGTDITAQDRAEVQQHIEYHLELLAKAEHARWMQWHLDNDWEYAPTTNEEKQRHNCLVAYQKLDDENKNKDRVQIRHYPAFAEKAGMKIVFAK